LAEQISVNTCYFVGFGKCTGDVKNGICESHTKEIFRIAWR
jgi:hypothetical protein